MSKSLTGKTANGVAWCFIDSIANSGITFLIGIVLARMLSPEEYGLIGIIIIFIALFQSVVDSGLSTALIRDKNAGSIDFDTAFVSNVFLGLVMAILLFFLAPAIAHFFHREELLWLTKAMSSILLINSFAAVQRALFVRAIDFRSQAIASVFSSVTSGFVGIGMAYFGMGVWSLVGQQISRFFIQTVFLWILSKWRPQIRFSFESFKRMFTFGWKIMVSGIIASLWNESYQIVIGKFYTPASLGHYTRAKQFSDIFSSHITSIMQRVTFPALSSIQEEQVRLKDAFRKLVKLLMLVSSFLLLGVAVSSESLIYTVIGPQWDVAVKYLPILCMQVLFYPVNSLNLNLLIVKGRSDIYLKLEIIKRIIALVPLALGIFVGIYAMLWGSVVSGLIAFFLNAIYSGRQIHYTVIEQIRDILPVFLMSSMVAAIMYVAGLIEMNYVSKLMIQILIGTIAAIIIVRLFYYKEVQPYIAMVLGHFRTKKAKNNHCEKK